MKPTQRHIQTPVFNGNTNMDGFTTLYEVNGDVPIAIFQNTDKRIIKEIVQSVNNHDKLVEALKYCDNALKYFHPSVAKNTHGIKEVKIKIQQALQSVESETL